MCEVMLTRMMKEVVLSFQMDTSELQMTTKTIKNQISKQQVDFNSTHLSESVCTYRAKEGKQQTLTWRHDCIGLQSSV